MKMKVIDRIMLALYAVLGILALAVLCACVLWPEIYAVMLASLIRDMCGSEVGKIAGCALIAALVAGLVHLIALAFKKDVRGPKSSVSVQNTDSGAVRVSVQAMDALVKRAIGNQEGVLGVKSRIVNHDDSITVHIDMALAMDSHIPNITMLMQRRIKRYIEETSGIAVREVIVLVSEVREEAPAAIPAPVQEQPVAEEAEPVVIEEEVQPEADAEAEVEEISETDELLAMEEAAELEEAAVLEEVLSMEGAPEEEEASPEEEELVGERAVFIDGSPFKSERDRMIWEGTWMDDGPCDEEELMKLDGADEESAEADEEKKS